MTERWLPVRGYESNYEVSDLGHVRNATSLHVLKAHTLQYGHQVVKLSLAGAKVGFLVHRLVLEAFVGPCPEGMEGCHWDGDSMNNRLENLRRDTHEENMQDLSRIRGFFNSKKTHCPQGHEYTAANTYSPPSRPGERSCRQCRRERRPAEKQRQRDRMRKELIA